MSGSLETSVITSLIVEKSHYMLLSSVGETSGSF